MLRLLTNALSVLILEPNDRQFFSHNDDDFSSDTNGLELVVARVARGGVLCLTDVVLTRDYPATHEESVAFL